MFKSWSKNVFSVEEKILSFLGPRDLIKARLVCKDWYSISKKLESKQHEDLFKEAFFEPVTCFATIYLPKYERHISVTNESEVYILCDDSILQFDTSQLHIKLELKFPLHHSRHWQDLALRQEPKELTVSDDTQIFTVMHCQNNVTKCYNFKILSEKEPILGWSLKGVLSGGGQRWQHDSTMKTIQQFCSRIETQCLYIQNSLARPWISDIVWLKDKSASIFSVSFKFNDREESRLFGLWVGAGEVPKLLAIIPMVHVKLHIIGKRVLCHANIPIMHHYLPQQPTDYINSDRIIIFDLWDPNCVRQENINVTKLEDLSNDFTLKVLSV